MNNFKKYKIFLPLFLFIVLLSIWSAFWFYGRDKLLDKITLSQINLSKSGQVVNCAHNEIIGFPYRYQLNCEPFTFVNSDYSINAPSVKSTALVWRPNHIIAVITSPLKINNIELEFNSLQSSVNVTSASEFKLSTVFEMLLISQSNFLKGLKANRFEVHSDNQNEIQKTYLIANGCSILILIKWMCLFQGILSQV